MILLEGFINLYNNLLRNSYSVYSSKGQLNAFVTISAFD